MGAAQSDDIYVLETTLEQMEQDLNPALRHAYESHKFDSDDDTDCTPIGMSNDFQDQCKKFL